MEEDKAIRKLGLISAFLEATQGVPSHIANSLQGLVTCAENDMDNFNAYWGGITKVCSTLEGHGIESPVGRGRLPDLPNEVIVAQKKICDAIAQIVSAAYASTPVYGSVTLARGGQPFADADAAGKAASGTAKRNTTKWYRNHMKNTSGDKGYDSKVPMWDGTLNKKGAANLTYPVVEAQED